MHMSLTISGDVMQRRTDLEVSDKDQKNESDEESESDDELGLPQRMAVPSVFPLPRDLATAQALAVAAIHNAHAAGRDVLVRLLVAHTAAAPCAGLLQGLSYYSPSALGMCACISVWVHASVHACVHACACACVCVHARCSSLCVRALMSVHAARAVNIIITSVCIVSHHSCRAGMICSVSLIPND